MMRDHRDHHRLVLKCMGLVLFILLGLAMGCARPVIIRQADEAFRARQWDKAVALYSRLVRKEPENVEYQSRYWWSRMMAARVHEARGDEAARKGDWETALVEYEMAMDLDPARKDLEQKLEKTRQHFSKQPVKPTIQRTIKPRFEGPSPDILKTRLTMQLVDTPLHDIIKTLAQVASLQVMIDPDVPNSPVTVDFNGLTLEEALDRLSRMNGLFYRFVNSDSVVFAPDTEQKHKQYQDYWAFSIPIQYTRATNVVQILRSAIRLPYVAADSRQDVITIMGTRRQIEAAARLVAQIDHPPAEVLIHVDILEVSRNVLQDYGLTLRSGNQPGIDASIQPKQEITLDPGPILSRSDFTLVNLPGLVARLLKQSGQARLLASIPVRTVEGETGRVRFGSDVPVPQTTFVPIATGGVNQQPITSFAYRTVGLNLDMTPRVNPDGLVTLQLRVESSSIAGTGFAGVPVFATSLIEKTIRLKPNETSLIAGLIRRQTRDTVESLPGIESVPLLGEIFKGRRREQEENELVVLITPHILRPRPVLDVDGLAVPVPPPESRTPYTVPMTFPYQPAIPEETVRTKEEEQGKPPA